MSVRTQNDVPRVATAKCPTLLIANPSPDIYGSDLQMLQTVSAMHDRGWRVVVVLPESGPLAPLLTRRGAEVQFASFPVLRRANMSAVGALALGVAVHRTFLGLHRCIRRIAPDVVLVNTITIPWWLAVARTTHTPSVCHVHEADARASKTLGLALNLPLFLANSIVANGSAAADATTHDLPALKRRTQIIFNGVEQPAFDIPPGDITGPLRLAVVGRLSPRKAADVALEAVAILRRAGRDVRLEICGTAFRGYEWYEQDLRRRAAEDDLAGAVTFSGYVSPIWPALRRTHVLLAPCANESFGNAVVEAQLAGRPVVAARSGGHLETIIDEETGLLVRPGDPREMATAVERLLDDHRLTTSLAQSARDRALEHFSLARYRREVADLIGSISELPSSLQQQKELPA